MAIRISKRCGYALRAVLELAFRGDSGPVSVQEIAGVQGIPPRFLEIILNELRQAGIVASHRGNAGGYTLADLPQRVTVAQVIEAIEGPISIGAGTVDTNEKGKYVRGDAALDQLWAKVNASMTRVCRDASLETLADWERRSQRSPVPDYSI
ncbi:MAG: Rrf2 family transcriptional regulator [Sedimentisphaerales bacterium]|nr:Rrf2 family transcriptional regulator [Sedimentisphaerales bacterium]